MHHREEHLTSNTVNLGMMTLNNAEIFLRGVPGEQFTLSKMNLDLEATLPLFLFPSEDATILNEDNLKNLNPTNLPIRLIVPDGTWSQAKKVYRRDFQINNDTPYKIRPVKLPDGMLKNYRLRKSPRPDGLSTFEAVSYALGIIEKNEMLCEDLLQMFETMVSRIILSRRNFRN